MLIYVNIKEKPLKTTKKRGENNMMNEWDFPVEMRPIENAVLFGGEEVTLPERKMVVFDIKNRRGISLVSDRYQLIPHRQVYKTIMRKIVKLIGKPVGIPRTLAERKGALFSLYVPIWKKNVDYDSKKGDVVEFGIRAINSYDGKKSLTIEVAALRLVCSNGMTKPSNEKLSLLKPHRGIIEMNEFDKKIESMLKKVIGQMKIMVKDFRESIYEKMDGLEIKRIFERVNLGSSYLDHAAREIVQSLENKYRIILEEAADYITENNEGWDCTPEEALLVLNEEELKKIKCSKWKVYNAFTSAISHNYGHKSIHTKRKQEIEAYELILT